MKKILIVTTIKVTVRAFLIPFIISLQEQGYEVTVATNCAENVEIKELQNVNWVNIPFSRTPFSLQTFAAAMALKSLFKVEKFEFIHVHTPVAAFLTRLVARIYGQKNIIYTVHGFHFYKGAPLKNWIIFYSMEKIAAFWTDVFLTMNNEDFEQAKKISRSGNVFKVNGVGLNISAYQYGDGNKVRTELNLAKDDFILSCIGELNLRKNQIQILRALLELKDLTKVKLLLIGLGSSENDLRKFVMTHNLDKNVFFLGYRKDIGDILSATNLIISISKHEGLPRNIMEAMAAGKPVLGTDIRGVRDLIADTVNGILVPVNDNIATAKAIDKFISDSEFTKECGINNKKKIQNYDIKNVVNDTERIIFNFLAKK